MSDIDKNRALFKLEALDRVRWFVSKMLEQDILKQEYEYDAPMYTKERDNYFRGKRYAYEEVLIYIKNSVDHIIKNNPEVSIKKKGFDE